MTYRYISMENEAENTLRVSIKYRRNEMNYRSGELEVSGYELNASFGHTEGNCFKFMPMQPKNFRYLLMREDRFSKKKLDEFIEKLFLIKEKFLVKVIEEKDCKTLGRMFAMDFFPKQTKIKSCYFKNNDGNEDNDMIRFVLKFSKILTAHHPVKTGNAYFFIAQYGTLQGNTFIRSYNKKDFDKLFLNVPKFNTKKRDQIFADIVRDEKKAMDLIKDFDLNKLLGLLES